MDFAVHQIGALKAPAPDGIHAIFYHTYWHYLKNMIWKKRKLDVEKALKLDWEKAYDFLNWNFIRMCLSKFGFSEDWIRPVNHECISSVSFSILLNGQVQTHFVPSRGRRQGGSLSPYIILSAAIRT